MVRLPEMEHEWSRFSFDHMRETMRISESKLPRVFAARRRSMAPSERAGSESIGGGGGVVVGPMRSLRRLFASPRVLLTVGKQTTCPTNEGLICTSWPVDVARSSRAFKNTRSGRRSGSLGFLLSFLLGAGREPQKRRRYRTLP